MVPSQLRIDKEIDATTKEKKRRRGDDRLRMTIFVENEAVSFGIDED